MPPERRYPLILRMVEGIRGRVRMKMDITVRFDYGSRVPWVHRVGSGIEFAAGPDAVRLESSVEMSPRGLVHEADFVVEEGQRIPFTLSWHPSHERKPPSTDESTLLTAAETWWNKWSSACAAPDQWREPIVRSLIVLKALTYGPTGGIIAAPTTSLPEDLAGIRNWDYRYCWLRDSTFSLYALMMNGYFNEARSWRDWLLRAIAGQPELMQIMYGPAGENRLTELEFRGWPASRTPSPSA